jgi:DNA repair exonuclease SbcCD ATPase subunit
MDEKELQEIKERAEEVKKQLRHGSYMQNLIENDVPKLVAEVEDIRVEVEELKIELEGAGVCPHGNFYEDRRCISCFGDGTEEKRNCSKCGTETWHRGEKCLSHDMTAPKPYELLKGELEQLRVKIQAAKEENSARISEADKRLKAIESSFTEMRDALEYVRVRLGSVNLGESLHKIDQALSASTAHSSTASGGNTGVSEGVDEFTKWRQQMSKKG